MIGKAMDDIKISEFVGRLSSGEAFVLVTGAKTVWRARAVAGEDGCYVLVHRDASGRVIRSAMASRPTELLDMMVVFAEAPLAHWHVSSPELEESIALALIGAREGV